jgi:hypothetical protein
VPSFRIFARDIRIIVVIVNLRAEHRQSLVNDFSFLDNAEAVGFIDVIRQVFV